jgi:hypothetical protein
LVGLEDPDLPEGWHGVWYDNQYFLAGEPPNCGCTGGEMWAWLTETGYGWTKTPEIPLSDDTLEVWEDHTHDDCLRQLAVFSKALTDNGLPMEIPEDIKIPRDLEHEAHAES